MKSEFSGLMVRGAIVALLFLSMLLLSCGPVALPFPTRKPPAPFFDVASLLPGSYLMAAPSLSEDGRYLTVGETEFAGVTAEDLVIFDLQQQEVLQEVYTGGVFTTAVSPSGRRVAVDNGYRKLLLFETGVITPTRVITGAVPTWSPDGQQLAYATSSESSDGQQRIEIHILEMATGRERSVFERASARAYIWPLTWSPDGRKLAFNLNFPPSDPLEPDKETASFFSLELRNDSTTVITKDWEILSLQFSPDSSKILVLGAPLPVGMRDEYKLYVMDNAGTCHRVKSPIPNLVEVALSADGETVAVHVKNPHWLLVAQTSEVLPQDYWETGVRCSSLLK